MCPAGGNLLLVAIHGGCLAVHLDDEPIPLGNHFLGKPLSGRDEGIADAHDHIASRVEAAGASRINRAVDLRPRTRGKFRVVARPCGSKSRTEVETAVAAVVDPGLHAEMEVLEVAAFGIKMTPLRDVGLALCVPEPIRMPFSTPPIARLTGMELPAGQVASVEQRHETSPAEAVSTERDFAGGPGDPKAEVGRSHRGNVAVAGCRSRGESTIKSAAPRNALGAGFRAGRVDGRLRE